MQTVEDTDLYFPLHVLQWSVMDISLIIALICLIICMYIPKIYMEGRVSQIFDIGLSFCFIVCRR